MPRHLTPLCTCCAESTRAASNESEWRRSRRRGSNLANGSCEKDQSRQSGIHTRVHLHKIYQRLTL
jgi:hypothetical protein